MYSKILTFSSPADTTLLEYDPATAQQEEINTVIAKFEANEFVRPHEGIAWNPPSTVS